VGEDALLLPSTRWSNGQFVVLIEAGEPRIGEYTDTFSNLWITNCQITDCTS
jgi:hypothetical protein